MEQFLKAVAVALLAVVIVLMLKSSEKGIAQLLSVLVCCIVIGSALTYVEPVIEFIRSVRVLSGLDEQYLMILFKSVGISVTAEIASLLCDDSGNAAMGKTIQFLATAVILCLSLPLLTALLQLIGGIVDGL